MSAAPLSVRRTSAFVADDEPVFQSGTRISGAAVPVFGDTGCWPAACLPRPANRRLSQWQITFPGTDPVWNLRLREVAFALLNPAHDRLRAAGVFQKADPRALSTVILIIRKLTVLAAWATAQGLPGDLSQWATADLGDFLAETSKRADPSTVRCYVVAIRTLHDLAGVLTGGGLPHDPWPGQTSARVARSGFSDTLTTPVISPQVWWPLLRAAWAYIHTFAPDLLGLRDRLDRQQQEAPAAGSRRMRPAEVDALLERWLADPGNLVPLAASATPGIRPAQPVWEALSRIITCGARGTIFSSRKEAPHAARRRKLIFAAVADGRAAQVDPAGYASTAPSLTPLERKPVSREETDRKLAAWLAEPGTVIPVRGTAHHYSTAGAPSWDLISRLVLGERNPSIFAPLHTAGRERRATITAAISAGHPTTPVGASKGAGGGHQALVIDCGSFAQITRPDGTTGPWRPSITLADLDTELRMVRAAGYVFVAALSMMRDSEIQEIERDAIVSYYGSPAIRSRRTKHDPHRSVQRWWITEPVAEAVRVLERLSWHPSHVFAPMPKNRRGGGRDRGITAADDIDFFIERVNKTAHSLGLEPIPAAKIRPHMFRRTMASIAAHEPDGQIALGIQLKHAARRALANRLTHGYGQRDPAWATDADREYELAAARRLVDLLAERQAGHQIAVGPGAARLHQGIDAVIAATRQQPRAHAQLASQQTLITLLRGQFPDLHWGTLNHCLFNAATAECQNALPDDQRGQGPLLGACQPARCRNSAVTSTHIPIWLAEEDDLRAMLSQPSLGTARRESLTSRLADVQLITDAWRGSTQPEQGA